MRCAIAAALMSLAIPAIADPGGAATSPTAATEQVAKSFYAYSLPLMEVARRRDVFLAAHPANVWVHTRALADHAARDITTPNNDTVYSTAFIDLRDGPVTLSVPETGRRYLSVALMDMYSNNFAYVGTRVTGGHPASLTLVGPGQPAPAVRGRLARAPGPFVWAIARTLVAGPDDLAKALAVQDRLTITGLTAHGSFVKAAAQDASPDAYLASARMLIGENPPLPADAPIIARFKRSGLLGGAVPMKTLSSDIARGFASARTAMVRAKRPGQVVNGWIYPQPNHGDYGTDYDYRAAVAVTGLAALGQLEATYLRSAPATQDNLFDGGKAYQLHFAPGKLPPVDAFWSLSMYERTLDGGFYFVDNPLHRYAIGDRTPGLTYNADGSLDLWIGHADPGRARRANWLPSPAGPFALSLRAYLPRAGLRDGSWRAPAVEVVK